MTRLLKLALVFAGISVSGLAVSDQIQPLLDVGASRQVAEKSSQSKIDEMDEQTSVIVSEFKTVSKQIEGLRVYNAQMRQQIQRQEERLKEIDKTLKEAQVMQRQIPPFTRRMLAGIETSIELDLPVPVAERKERIALAKAALDNPTVSPAEGLRQVLEAFNVEAEYGRKIDAYKDSIVIENELREGNILRVGRLAMVFQTADETQTHAWNNASRSWEELDNSYRNPTRRGLRIANKLATVDLMELPLPAATEVN
jgi:archaellum component FlaC